ncbi:MAG: VWA domain-containing protein [Deltaproteobacteria bacterium]|jgi:hypothetical protein|nr:VWA domain-containing protein [Deltaproteobacteria bacterium]
MKFRLFDKQSSNGFVATAARAVLVGASVLSVAAPAMALNVKSHNVRYSGGLTQIRMEVDVYQGTAPSALDILFVIDDSASMGTHQKNLLNNVSNLVNASLKSGVDLHAAVITTTVDSEPYKPLPGYVHGGRLIGVTNKVAKTSDGNFEQVLTENLKIGMQLNGSGNEQPFQAVRLALSEPLLSNENAGFLRPNAALAVFLLTDADDQSLDPVATYVDFLRQLKQNAVTMHAAFIPTTHVVVPGATCDRSGEPAPARIEEALTALGTLAESVNLCETDYSSRLSTIGSKYEMIGVRSVQFKLPAIISSIKVTYGSTVLVAGDVLKGWVYDSSKLQLQLGQFINWRSQPAGTKLVVEYTVD